MKAASFDVENMRSVGLSPEVHELLLADGVYHVINQRFEMMLDHYESDVIPAAVAARVADCLEQQVRERYTIDQVISRRIGWQVEPVEREIRVEVEGRRVIQEVAALLALLRAATDHDVDVFASL